jgi:hypothetical protein
MEGVLCFMQFILCRLDPIRRIGQLVQAQLATRHRQSLSSEPNVYKR